MEWCIYLLLVWSTYGITSPFRELVSKDQAFQLYVQLQVSYLFVLRYYMRL